MTKAIVSFIKHYPYGSAALGCYLAFMALIVAVGVVKGNPPPNAGIVRSESPVYANGSVLAAAAVSSVFTSKADVTWTLYRDSQIMGSGSHIHVGTFDSTTNSDADSAGWNRDICRDAARFFTAANHSGMDVNYWCEAGTVARLTQ